MVLDKTSILDILCKDKDEFEKKREKKLDAILIQTSTGKHVFDQDQQVGNDSIDLRISDSGYKMSTDREYLNTLSETNLEDYFESVTISMKGYILNPGELLFIPTLEKIALSGDLIGRVTGRSVFARMGLTIHCTQDKFSSGINSVAGLQIKNNSPIPLKIFPYQKLAQIIIQKTSKNRHPYEGRYCDENEYTLPFVLDKDREQYNKRDKAIILDQKPNKRPIWKRKKTSIPISICKLAFSGATTIAMGIFGCVSNITGLIVSGVSGLFVEVSLLIIELNWWDNNERNN